MVKAGKINKKRVLANLFYGFELFGATGNLSVAKSGHLWYNTVLLYRGWFYVRIVSLYTHCVLRGSYDGI